MIERKIQVLDPLCGKFGSNQETKDRHKYVAFKLHDALFNCLNELYAGWPTPKDKWDIKFPLLVDTKFTRCASFFCPVSCASLHVQIICSFFFCSHIFFPHFTWSSMADVIPSVYITMFCRAESGPAILHYGRHFDGNRLKVPLTKVKT
jgi:hypothetical protein